MSTTIDQRVVEMKFDNKQFESGVKTTTKSLDTFKKSLDLQGATKGLENVQTAAQKCDMSALSNAVATITSKFTALEIIGITALSNITNSAINAGKKIVSAFTIDPIKTGFQEYETQINAVQTIMANTQKEGTTLEIVNSALDELNTYADKTIYNFTEMTRNIGTFTAAGVKLDDSVSAIKGIANLAALSGSSSQQASTAMYQLSQALAAGRVSLQDWNSVVNAGMGGQVFQDALKRTAKAMGIVVDESIAFRESISGGDSWLSSEVLTATLSQFTGDLTDAHLAAQGFNADQIKIIQELAATANDAATKVKTFTQLLDTLKEAVQSGWSQTWRLIIGDFEESKAFYTRISESLGDLISKFNDARNDLLGDGLSKNFIDNDVFDDLQKQGYMSDEQIERIKKVAKDYGIAIDDMISECGSFEETLAQGWFTEEIFIDAMSDGNIALNEQGKAFTDLTGIADKVIQGVYGNGAERVKKLTEAGYEYSDVQSVVNKILDGTIDISKDVTDAEIERLELTEDEAEALRALKIANIENNAVLKETLDYLSIASGRENLVESIFNSGKALMSILTPIGEAFREVFAPITGDQIYDFTKHLREFTEKLKVSDDIASYIKKTFAGLFSVIGIGVDILSATLKLLSPILGIIVKIGGALLQGAACIGSYLQAWGKFVKDVGVIAYIGDTIKMVLELIESGVDILAQSLREAFDVPDAQYFYDFLDSVGGKLKYLVDNATTVRDSLIDTIKSIDIEVAKSKVCSILDSWWQGIKTVAGGIAYVAKVMGDTFMKIIDGLGLSNYSSILDVINTILFGGILKGALDIASSIKDILNSVGNIGNSFASALDALKDTLEQYQKTLKAEALLKLAIAIGIIAAAIVALTLLDPGKMTTAATAIGLLMGELVMALRIFSEIDGNLADTANGILIMLGIGVALNLVALAIYKVAQIDSDKLREASETIGGAMAALVGAVCVLAMAFDRFKGLNTDAFAKIAVVMIAMSVAVGIMVGAVYAATLIDEAEVGKASLVVTGIGAFLLGMVALTKLIDSKLEKDVLNTAFIMVAMSAAVFLLVKNLEDICAIDVGNGKLATAGGVLAGLLLSLGLALKLAPSKASVMKFGINMFIMAKALTSLLPVLEDLTEKVSWKMTGAVVILAGTLAALAGALYLMNGSITGALALGVATLALMGLIPIIIQLASLDYVTVLKGLSMIVMAFGAIGLSGLILTPVIPILLGLGTALTLIGIGAMGLGVGLFLVSKGLLATIVAFTILAGISTAGALAITSALSVIVNGLAGLIPIIIEQIGNGIVAFCEVITKGAPAIAEAIVAVLIAVVEQYSIMIPIVVESVLTMVDAVLSSLAQHTPAIIENLFVFLIGLIDGIAENLPTLIQSVVNLFMSFFSGVVTALQSIDTEILIKGIAGVGLITALMFALAAVAAVTPLAMLGVVGFGIVIAELSVVLAAIGALSQIPGLQWLINESASFLQSIGTAIGGFVGGLVGGFMGGVTSQFAKIGTDLSDFMTNVTPFIEGLKNIDQTVIDGMTNLSAMILMLTGATMLDGLTSWLTGGVSIADFGTELVPFGKSIKEFSEEVKGVDAEAIVAASTAGKNLAEMLAALPDSGGVAGWFMGENDADLFIDSLVPFGIALTEFSQEVQDVDADAINNAATAGKELASMLDALPNSGGVSGWLAGENDAELFVDNLVPFGEAIAGFSESVKDLDADAISNASTAGKNLAEMLDALPNSGGWSSDIFGENDISVIGEQLLKFALDYLAITTCLENVTEEDVTKVNNIIDTLSNLNFENKFELSDSFSENLQALGRSVGLYYSYFAVIDTDRLALIINATNQLVGMFSTMELLDTTVVETFTQTISNIGELSINGFIDAFDNSHERVFVAINMLFVQIMIRLKALETEFYNVGTYYVEGFANGITEATFKAEIAAYDLAMAAKRTVASTLGIQSPSKVGRSLGGFYGEGFTLGIQDYNSKASQAGATMAENAKTGLSKAISNINASVIDNLDNQPTIRPVLDLSNVKNGASQLNTLFSRSQAISISTGMNTPRTNTIQNGENSSSDNGTQYNFTQNNYSPKALSRLEIYRQTKNQFSSMKGLVKV